MYNHNIVGLKDVLKSVLDHNPSKSDIAQHIADRLSAQEQIRSIAIRDGDGALTQATSNKIRLLRQEAAKNGLDRDNYPGLYR